MCGGGKPPKVVKRDPKAEAEQAANEAAFKANSEIAAIRKRKQGASLLAAGANGTQGVVSPVRSTLLASASGKNTLGA